MGLFVKAVRAWGKRCARKTVIRMREIDLFRTWRFPVLCLYPVPSRTPQILPKSARTRIRDIFLFFQNSGYLFYISA